MKKRINIVLITPLFPPIAGGGATHSFYLAHALGSLQGVRVHVIAPEPPLPKGDKHWFVSKRVSIHRVKAQQDLGKVPFAQFLEMALRIYAKIISNSGFRRHESIVVHGQHWGGIFVGMHLKDRFHIPLVATIHKTPIGGALGDTVKDTDASYCHFNWLTSWPIDVFIAGSAFFQAELSKHIPQKARVEFIHHGVPGTWLRGQATKPARSRVMTKLDLTEDIELVLCPVRWDPRKRVHDFIAAAGRVLGELRDINLKFLITGLVGTKDLDSLMNRAQEAGIKQHLVVKHLDFVDMPAVFRTSSLVVYPTDREGLGLSVLESMSLFTPVVATDAEGIREIITHEKDGYLYAAGEDNHLAQIMVKLLRDRRHAADLVQQAKSKVESRFNDMAMAMRHLEVYRSLI